MRQEFLTDEEVEMEIERLSESETVALARCEQRLKYKKRQKLYNLRFLEKRGQELMKNGVTKESLLKMEAAIEEEE